MDFLLNAAGLAFVAFIAYAFVKDMGRALASDKRRRSSKQQIKQIRLGLVPCPRCGGTGYLPQFSHVENGIFFLCRGYTKYGRYDSLEARKQRHEEAFKARNEIAARAEYLGRYALHYESLSATQLKGILSNSSGPKMQDDEIAIIRRILKNKLQREKD